jgi:hypothetical protein
MLARDIGQNHVQLGELALGTAINGESSAIVCPGPQNQLRAWDVGTFLELVT